MRTLDLMRNIDRNQFQFEFCCLSGMAVRLTMKFEHSVERFICSGGNQDSRANSAGCCESAKSMWFIPMYIISADTFSASQRVSRFPLELRITVVPSTTNPMSVCAGCMSLP